MRTLQTIIFVALIVTLSNFGSDVLSWLRGVSYLSGNETEISSKHAMFLGHWLGSSGTIIDISGEGRADFYDGKSQLRSAHLKIKGAQLIITLPGFQKALTINDPPRLGRDGLWRMRLDEELFVRDSHDIMV
jgi:hypothetical protein